MIERTFDAARVNEVINHPSILPWIRGAANGALDLSAAVFDDGNYVLFGEHGGFILIRHQPGLYEVHTQILPEGRGQWALDAVNEAQRWMFGRTDAVEIVTRVPHGNIAARALAKRGLMQREFTNKQGWVQDGQFIPADIFSLSVQRWTQLAPGLEQRGQWFHDRLEQEYRAAGKTQDTHPDDDTHDRYVGAAVEMIFGGQPQKGVVFYNRWAVMAGYQPVSLISTNPVTIDIRDAVLIMRGNDFWMT